MIQQIFVNNLHIDIDGGIQRNFQLPQIKSPKRREQESKTKIFQSMFRVNS